MKSETISTPYQGLSPFKEQDQAYFFGREQETQDLVSSLLDNRLTLLFGSCGAGKTSLLNAGVAALLRRQTSTPLTRNVSFKRIIICFNNWSQRGQNAENEGFLALKLKIKAQLIAVSDQEADITLLSETEQLKESLRSVLGDVLEEESPKDLDPSLDLTSVLTTTAKRIDGNVIILLDQFEKYLNQAGTKDEIQKRDKELIEAITHADPRVRFLIAIREENLQMLDRFRKKLPQLFTGAYRLNPLSPSQAQDVIKKPLEIHRISSTQGPGRADTALVEQILTDLPAVKTARTGDLKNIHYREITRDEVRVEASYLQLVLSRLWEVAVKQDVNILSLKTYNSLGGCTSIIDTHLENARAKHRYTPSGNRIKRAIKTARRFRQVAISLAAILLISVGIALFAFQGKNQAEKRIQIAAIKTEQAVKAHRQAELKRKKAEIQTSQTRSQMKKVRLAWEKSETKRKHAEAKLALSDSQAKKAEMERKRAETERERVEIKLALSVSQTQKAESARKKAETKRKRAEAKLALSDSQIKKAEMERKRAAIALTTSKQALRNPRNPAVSQLRLAPGLEQQLALILKATRRPFTLDNTLGVKIDKLIKRTSSQNALFSLNDRSDKVSGITFSPDGKQIATTHPGKTAKIWDADSGKILLTLRGHTQHVTSIAFSPDATRIATASTDKTIKIWDANTGRILVSLKGHSGSVTDLAFSPNGRLLATVSTDKKIKIWYVKSGEIRATLSGHQGSVVAVAFRRDGLQIATTSTDKTAKTWEIASGKIVHTFVGHTDTVTGVAYSSDGQQIATTSANKSAKIWDTNSGKLVATHQPSSLINGIAFSNAGRRIITASADKRIQVYALNIEELVKLAQVSDAQGK